MFVIAGLLLAAPVSHLYGLHLMGRMGGRAIGRNNNKLVLLNSHPDQNRTTTIFRTLTNFPARPWFSSLSHTDGNPMLRVGDTGDWVGTFEGHKGAVWGVALNRTATLAASGAADFSGKVWNAVTGEEMHSFQHKHIVKSVAFDGYCESLVTGSNEKLIRVFSLQEPTAVPDVYMGHGGAIKRALFCRQDKCLVSCADDKTLRMWDRRTGTEVQRLDFPSNPNSLELSRDQQILTVTHGAYVSFYDCDTLQKLKEVKVPTLVSAASLHPDKHVFVCGGEDFTMYKFDYNTGNEIGEYGERDLGRIY